MLRTSGRAALFDLMLCRYQALFDLYLLVRARRRPLCGAGEFSLDLGQTWGWQGQKHPLRSRGVVPRKFCGEILDPYP
jgi:hypothetical protein